MNRISVTYNGFKIDCEESNLKQVLGVLQGIESHHGGSSGMNEQAAIAQRETQPQAHSNEPIVGSESSMLMRLMNKWNRLHPKDVSVRGRRFTDEDRKLLAKIAGAANKEEANFSWVATTIRVCSSSLYRAQEWEAENGDS